MSRRFNGVYSYRAGSHGTRKASAAISINSDFWTCPNGHRNPSFELIDDRATGGFVHREQVTTCRHCVEFTDDDFLDEATVEAVSKLKPLTAEYPEALLVARRAGFVAQIQALDPDACDIDTPSVSEHQDERNSRPEPY